MKAHIQNTCLLLYLLMAHCFTKKYHSIETTVYAVYGLANQRLEINRFAIIKQMGVFTISHFTSGRSNTENVFLFSDQVKPDELKAWNGYLYIGRPKRHVTSCALRLRTLSNPPSGTPGLWKLAIIYKCWQPKCGRIFGDQGCGKGWKIDFWHNWLCPHVVRNEMCLLATNQVYCKHINVVYDKWLIRCVFYSEQKQYKPTWCFTLVNIFS